MRIGARVCCLMLAGCSGGATNAVAPAANAPVAARPAPPAGGVLVTDASIRLPVVAGAPGALYATLSSGGPTVHLVAIRSPALGDVMLHETVEANGMSTMRPLIDTSFAPGRDLVLAPGGKHGMVMGVAPGTAAGTRVPVTFDLDGAPDVTIDVPVQAIGGDQ